MSPSDIKQALQETLLGGVSLNTSTYIILVSSWFLGIVISGFVGKYFGKRGETAAVARDLTAIKEQLRQTTAATEEIKAQISGELWLKQKRLELKSQCYSLLAEHLGELAVTIKEAIAILADDTIPGGVEARERAASQRLSSTGALIEKIRRSGSVARIAVAPAVRTLLSSFGDEWNAAKTLPDQDRIAHGAWLKVLDAARTDLFGEEQEIGTK